MTTAQRRAITSISLSAVKAYQRCQQLYDYRYIQRLQRRGRPAPLELGIVLHEYFDQYYTALMKGLSGKEAHFLAQGEISLKWTPELKRLSQVAFMAGDEELAKEIADMPRKLGTITSRYFEARGLADAERYEVLFVEMKLDNHFTKAIRSRGRGDLGTRDRQNGRVSLWEHKSTKNVPPPSTRLRDLQTLLYAEQLRRFYEMDVDSVIWNYVRTKEPTKPEVLKSRKVPTLSKAGNIDTTWEVYEAAAKEAGVELDDSYDEMRERLEGRETTIFFPRYEQVIVANSTMMLRDYLRTGYEIRRYERRRADGEVEPVRTLSQECDYCEYAMLCVAAITGGDEDDLKRMKYESSRRN